MYQPHDIQDAVRWAMNAQVWRGPMVSVISSVQREHPRDQLYGVAAALLAMCEGIGLEPHDVLTRIEAARRDVEGLASQWPAMVAYARNEMVKP